MASSESIRTGIVTTDTTTGRRSEALFIVEPSARRSPHLGGAKKAQAETPDPCIADYHCEY